ncbi:MAG: FtsX-like permease family protein, partial [Gemmatimonadetes bacterium]|nr:FtsX-like permease family protein [Gemmatimonadota bacterium]
VRSDGLLNTLTKLKKTWAKLIPDKPFDYFFLDEDFAHQYRAEKRQGLIFSIFFGLAIFVGCLGLFGLISFSTQQRTREIGIRKVLGAPISSVVILLSKDFLKPVFLANFIAWPFAYYIINHWLQRFAYRIDVELWPFALGTIAVMSIALSTASFQAWKAACRNPVETLRQE